MKRTLKYFALAIVAAPFVAISCQREVSAPEAGSLASLQTKTFTMKFAPDTRITITPETPGTDNSVAKTRWEEGDEILIHGEYSNKTGYSVVVALTADDISNDGQTATVKVTLGTGTEEGTVMPYTRDDYVSSIYAAYPAAAVLQAEKHCYYYAVYANTNAPLMTGYDDGEGSILFRNNCAVISFVMPSSVDFDSYVFTGNNEETVGYESFVARYAQGTTELKQDQGVNSSGLSTSGPLTSISGAVVCDGETLNRICIPTKSADDDVVSFANGFTIKFMKDGVITKMATVSSAVSLNRNDYMPLGDISSHLKTFVDNHKSSIPTSGAVNLAATESANCYIITAPGIYKIPAVKGNSDESAGDVGGVELFWETCNSTAEVAANSVIAAVDYEDNWIYFQTPETLQPGNALIAAKNAAGTVIWSWHIWIPATAIETVGDYSVSKKYLMDRNLGALVATEVPSGDGTADIRSVGLYYQWGRKDPFVGYKWGASSSEVAVSGQAGRNAGKIEAQVTIDETVAAPASFIAFKGDWLAGDHNNELWGKSGDKTIYDPCPEGYRVPKFDAGDGLWSQVNTLSGFSASVAGQWWKLGDAVFPMGGCIDYNGSIDHAYDRCWLWSAKNNGTEDYGEAQYIYDNSGTWASQPQWGKRKACGASVRCVKVEGEVPEPEIPVTAATGVSIDGSMTEWADATAFPGSNDRILSWKYGYDDDNIYFYYEITASKIKYDAESGDYDWKSYIYIGFDTDNDETTGSRVGGGTDMETGGEAKVCIFPWRGNYNEGTFAFVNGVDGNGHIEYPVGTTIDGAHASAAGFISGGIAYLEVSIPRENIGTLGSKIAVAHAMDYYPTAKKAIPIE